MDRRDFIRRLGSTGVLIATSQLPVAAHDRPEVFSNRGSHERLSLSFATVEIGLQKPFSILHISDSHLTAAYAHESAKKQELHRNRTETFGGRQEEALHDALVWAKQHVDYVLHTGDLIDWQSEANLDLVRKYFGSGVIGTVGNHEFSPDMWLSDPPEDGTEAFKDRTRALLEEAYSFDTRFQAQVVNGVNFVTLDNVYGTVTEEQVRRFKMEAARGLPMVLCMHVPFFTDNIWRADLRLWGGGGPLQGDGLAEPTGDYKKQLEDAVTYDFISYLRRQPLLKCILAGHLHITVEDQFSATCREYVVAGGFLFHAREVMFV